MIIKRLTGICILVSLFLSLTLYILAQGPENQSEIRPNHLAGRQDSSEQFQTETFGNNALQSAPYPLYGSGNFFFPPYLSGNDRMGFGKTGNYDTALLNAGWYIDWGASQSPPHPGGMEYARTIYFNVSTSKCNAATKHSQVSTTYTGTKLINNVLANPGALWVIGNEPDSFYNGSPIHPELYAELYYYFYHTIKNTDPTAKVAVASIVQASPLRMEYLDNIRNHYQTTYSETLQSDLWNIHFYRFNEGSCTSNSWGAAIPPGASSNQGWSISSNELASGGIIDLPPLEASLRDFRQWMYDRGYGDRPLIITEYGVLPPPSYYSPNYSNAVAVQFLYDTFDMFRNATDPVTGLTTDGDRLVQMWNWFSTKAWYGGDLFSNASNLTVIGDAFILEATTHYTPYVDLQPVPPTNVVSSSARLTFTTYIQNRGNITAANGALSIALLDVLNSTTISETTVNLGDIPARYNNSSLELAHSWPLSVTDASTVTVNVSIASADGNPANDALLHSLTWPNWREMDLVVTGLQLSSGSPFLFNGPITLGVTATVVNRGLTTTPETTFRFKWDEAGIGTIALSPLETVPPLQSDEAVIFTATFPITQPGQYQLTALLPDEVDPIEYPDNNQITRAVGAIDANDLVFKKKGPFLAGAGDEISYTLTITNNSPITLTGVVITDAIPPGASYISGGEKEGNIVRWTQPALAPNGGVFEALFIITASNTVINNNYHLYAAENIHKPGDKAIVTIVEGTTPVLSLRKTAPETTVPGAFVSYTLRVANSGPVTLTNVLITDAIPAGATYVSGGTRLGDEVQWTISSLSPNGGEAEVMFIVTTTQTITNSSYRVVIAEGLSAAGQDEVVTVVGEGTVITPGPGDQTTVITDVFTVGVARSLQIEIPNNVVTQEVTISYAPVAAPTPPTATPYLWYRDLRFYLDVYLGTILLPGYELSAPITVTVTYTDTNFSDESKLGLYYFDMSAGSNGQWTPAGNTCAGTGSFMFLDQDIDANTLTVQICRLGQFALMQQVEPTFFPIVWK